MAAVTGRHRGDHTDATGHYGRHSEANPGGLSVAALLARVAEAGQAVRLAWRGNEVASVAERSGEFPTAVLPVVRSMASRQAEPDGLAGDDQETEPTTGTREARRWLRVAPCRKYLALKAWKMVVFMAFRACLTSMPVRRVLVLLSQHPAVALA